jgi:hypothetical protein
LIRSRQGSHDVRTLAGKSIINRFRFIIRNHVRRNTHRIIETDRVKSFCHFNERLLTTFTPTKKRLEADVLRSAEDPDCLKYADTHSVDILRSVLEVALEDDQVTPDELNLISKLQDKLSVSESTKRLILAQLNHFPRTGNEIHSPTEIRECLNALQRMGLIFYCNKLDGGQFVIPDEIARARYI